MYGLRWADMYFAANKWLREVRVTSETHCIMLHYTENLVIGLDRWFFFVLIAECLVLTRHPERVFHFRLKRVTDVIVVVVATLGALGLHHFWTIALEDDLSYGRTCRLRVRNLSGDKGNEMYGTLLRQMSPMIGDILPSIGVVVIYVLTVRIRVRRRQCTLPRYQCLACCQCFKSKVTDRATSTTVAVVAAVHEEQWVATCRKRAAYFVLDSESFESMADRVGPLLTLTFVVLVAPKLLIVQPLDQIVFQRLSATSGMVWSLIVDVANTMEAVSLAIPAIILLPSCRPYRLKLSQLLAFVPGIRRVLGHT